MFIFTIKDQSIEDVLENCVRGGILTKIIEQQISYESKLNMFPLSTYPYVIRMVCAFQMLIGSKGDVPFGPWFKWRRLLKRSVPIGDRISVHVKLLSQNKLSNRNIDKHSFHKKEQSGLLLVFKSAVKNDLRSEGCF